MPEQIFLVSPVAPNVDVETTHRKGGVRPGALRLGLLDNGKFNAGVLLDSIAETLHTCTNVADVIKERKASMSSAASSAALERLAKDSDLVISAMAD